MHISLEISPLFLYVSIENSSSKYMKIVLIWPYSSILGSSDNFVKFGLDTIPVFQLLLFSYDWIKVLEYFIFSSPPPCNLFFKLFGIFIIFIFKIWISQIFKILQITKKVHILHERFIKKRALIKMFLSILFMVSWNPYLLLSTPIEHLIDQFLIKVNISSHALLRVFV